MRRNSNAQNDRVSAHCKSTDAVNVNSEISGNSLYKFPTDAADKNCSPWILSCLLRVDVKVTLCTRSKGERAAANRFLLKDFEQLLLRRRCLHINRMC